MSKTENKQQNQQPKSLFTTRQLVTIALLSAMAFALQFAKTPLPIFPTFLEVDLSDIPGIIGAIALGPLAGVFIELIKNLLQLPFSHTQMVGELANFLAGAALVVPIGLVMRKNKSAKMFIVGSVLGVISMAAVSAIANLYILLPFYANVMGWSMEMIVSMSTEIFPAIDTLWEYILYTIVPFNLIKGTLCSIIGYIIYKYVGANIYSKA